MKPSVSLEQHNLPIGWEWAKLSEAALINPPRRPDIRHTPETPVTFVPMASVSEDTGTIAWPETRPLAEVSKGYTYFEEGDVLFAKITPCMQNGKHAIARGLANGFGLGTTEFHVVRPGDKVQADWIHRYLRQPWLLDEATRHFRGAVGQQRVPKEFLIDLPIPLPPLAEQKRIVGVLNEQMAAVERARKAAVERLEAAQALRGAHRESVFNRLDLSLSKLTPLKTAISSTRNGFGRRPRGEEQGPIVLRIADVSSGQVSYSDPRRVYMTPKELETYSLQPDDLLFVRVNGSQNLVGACVEFEEWAEPVAFNDHLIRVRLTGDLDSSFVAEFCKRRTVRTFLENRASTSAGQFTINRSSIEGIEIPVPDSKTQARCVSEIRSFEKFVNTLVGKISDELNSLDSLQSALLRRAFSGEV